MVALITILHIIVCLFLMLTVLLQSGKGGSMGSAFGGGNAATVFGGSGASSFLRRLTAGAATIFMLASMTLAYISSYNSSDPLEKFGREQSEEAKKKEEAKAKIQSEPSPAKTDATSAGATGTGADETGATTTEAPDTQAPATDKIDATDENQTDTTDKSSKKVKKADPAPDVAPAATDDKPGAVAPSANDRRTDSPAKSNPSGDAEPQDPTDFPVPVKDEQREPAPTAP